jgi:maltose O-acetyltransferase
MKSLIKKFIHREKYCTETYLEHLKKIGVTIGEGTRIYDPVNTHIDEYRPYLITIGKNCKIAKGVTILTHSGDWLIPQGIYGDVVGSADEVVIGDNVFIGMNAFVLKGVHIGDNVIVAANSVVHKDLESGYVYAGNPIKKLCTVEEHLENLKKVQLKEALNIYKNYVRVYKKEPPLEEYKEFFFMFCERDKEFPKMLKDALESQGKFEMSYNKFLQTEPMFNGYEKFLEWCREQVK